MSEFFIYLNTPAGQHLSYSVAVLLIVASGILAKRAGVAEAEFNRWLSSAEKLGANLVALSRLPMSERRPAAHELAKEIPLDGEELLHLASDAATVEAVANEHAEIKDPNTPKKKLSRGARAMLRGLAFSYMENKF